ncbi:thermonuclease family protein [Candidatus Collierbacteria bacterium]|nr:thermonuclease family protein [Candidatus Collierbacteria bacterium]
MRVLLPILLALSVVLNVFMVSQKRNTDTGTLVAGVIDGDTIVLSDNKTRVRLRYVDAPEKELCGSKEANELLTKLTVGKKVRLEKVIPDQYGRGMALVYVGDSLINKEMVASGWVRYHSDDTAEKEEIKKAGADARAAMMGVFGKCESKIPKDPRCVIKGNIDFPLKKFTYHLRSCTQYETAIVQEDKGERWFCTETEARKAGYVKAKTCR